GLMILAYIGVAALLIGGWISLWLRLAGYLTGRARAHLQLAYALIPIGGAGVFLGLSALTVSLLAAEGIDIAHLPLIRGLLLGAASLASLVLAGRMVARMALPAARSQLVMAAFTVAGAGAVLPWVVMYYVW
ncbi:MAG: 4Fe-4S binding protein, partial [Rhodocyclaceae bacterium]